MKTGPLPFGLKISIISRATVNSGVLGIEKCVEIIKSLYQCLVLSLIGCAFTGCCKRA